MDDPTADNDDEPLADPRRILVPTSAAKLRLDVFLAETEPTFSRSRLQVLMKDGWITLDGASAKPSTKLRGGEVIEFAEPPLSPSTVQAEALPLDILYEDDDLIAVNKTPGMVVHPGAGHSGGTLVNALLHHCKSLSGIGGIERPGIVHRLDRDTSGCIVAAKNDAAHQALATQFARRELEKIYLAIARGPFLKLHGTIDAPIGRHPVHRQKMAIANNHKGRESRTDWRVLCDLPIGTLIECILHSGRTHQIRVHLQHIGQPLLGDEIYGQRAGFPRQMLHAWKLGFHHPRTGELIRLTAPLPQDFLAAGVTRCLGTKAT